MKKISSFAPVGRLTENPEPSSRLCIHNTFVLLDNFFLVRQAFTYYNKIACQFNGRLNIKKNYIIQLYMYIQLIIKTLCLRTINTTC